MSNFFTPNFFWKWILDDVRSLWRWCQSVPPSLSISFFDSPSLTMNKIFNLLFDRHLQFLHSSYVSCPITIIVGSNLQASVGSLLPLGSLFIRWSLFLSTYVCWICLHFYFLLEIGQSRPLIRLNSLFSKSSN